MISLTSNQAIDIANLRAEIGDEFLYACLLLKLGEIPQYQQFCQDLVLRTGDPVDPYAAIALARVCAIGPCTVLVPDQLVYWATRGVAGKNDAAGLHVLSLAHYRASNYQLAIESVQRSNAAHGWSQQAKAQNWLVLAMARFWIGETDEAAHCLETARLLINQARPNGSDEQSLLEAPDWIELNVLLREAETLLRASKFKAKTAEPETLAYLEPVVN